MEKFEIPITELSIEIHAPGLEVNEFVLKNFSENEENASQLLSSGIASNTGKYVEVGRVQCPICKISV